MVGKVTFNVLIRATLVVASSVRRKGISFLASVFLVKTGISIV